MSETVTPGKVVLIHYTLRTPAGDVIDTSDGREPLAYLHGASNIVPGLERQLVGLTVGATVQAIVPPEEGYGHRNDDARHVLPREAFPDDMEIEVGLPIALEAEDGQVLHCFIIAIRDDQVMVDANHPLAGVDLHFDVEIVGIRSATAEEQIHGHPHGPDGTDGHHHNH